MQVIVFGRLSALQNGTDTHPERYRYRTLIGHIEGKDRFSDSELNNFLMVVGSETDQEVAGAAFGSLLAKDCLARKQFDITVVSLSGYGEWTTKIIRRHSLIRQLNSSPLTEENFENCLNEGDKVMHDLLLDLVSRDKFRLSRLAEKGANIKIRNRASQLLKKKNYR